MRPLKLCIGFLFFTAACAPVAEIKLYAPEKFTVARWNRIIPEMSQKAKIDADTEEKITKYLHTFSKVN